MKIKKKLVESKLIKESDDDLELSDVNPLKTSVADIADAVQADVDTATDGQLEVSDKDAIDIAQEIKDVGEVTNAGHVVMAIDKNADYADTKIISELFETLDEAKAAAEMFKKVGLKNGANVLVNGLPGAGKTAIVEQWCQDNGLTLVALNATDTKIESAINGLPLRDLSNPESGAALTYAYCRDEAQLGPLFNDLHPELEGKCILFVDELNRQKTAQLRRPFMSLFNEKRNANGSLDFKKNLLFSVVCINPSDAKFHDTGVGELTAAEEDRFNYQLAQFDSSNEGASNFYDGWMKKQLLDMDIVPPNSEASKRRDGYVGPVRKLSEEEIEKAKLFLRIHTIAKYIFDNLYLSDEECVFTTRDDAEATWRAKKRYVTSRGLFDGLANALGDKDRFLKWVDNKSRFTDEKVKMFHDILDDMPWDPEKLYKDYNLDKTPEQIVKELKANPASNDAANAAAEPEEDDDSAFFTGNSSGRKAKSGEEVESEIADVVGDWGL